MSQWQWTQHDLLKCILALLRSEATPCYIVGGRVREWLLSQPGTDIDLVVAGAAIPLARRIANETGGAFYVLDQETDTARIVYRTPSDLTVDMAAMRGPDIFADLRARDFTINAMAVDVREWCQPQPQVLDPCGGQSDLAARVLRATNELAFEQDPVRLLRAVRFAATLNLNIEPQTEFWMRRDASLITRPSAERVRQELALIMASPRAVVHVRRMDDLGLLRGVIPELATLKGVPQSPPHHNDVYEHTLDTVGEVERLTTFQDARLDPDEAQSLRPFAADLEAYFARTICEKRARSTLLKFAALLHDAAKPLTQSVEADGRIRFLGHERLSGEIAREVLTRLRFSTQEIHLVCTTVAEHMRPGLLSKTPPVTRRAVYRFFRDTGDAAVDVLMLSIADHRSARGPSVLIDHWRQHLELTHLMLDNYFRKPLEAVTPPPLVTGNDVTALLGLKPGPQVGQLLEAVREAQADGQVQTREEALEFLRHRPAG